MEKKKILVVTGRKDDFQLVERGLQDTYEVLHAKQDVLALAVINSIRPWAILADIKQQGMDGVTLCGVLQEKLGSSTCHFILYEEDKMNQKGRLEAPEAEMKTIHIVARGDGPPVERIKEWLAEKGKPRRPGQHNTAERPKSRPQPRVTQTQRARPTPSAEARNKRPARPTAPDTGESAPPESSPAAPPQAQRLKTASGKKIKPKGAQRLGAPPRSSQSVAKVRARGPIVEQRPGGGPGSRPRTRPAIHTPPPDEENVTWGELMKSDMDKEQLKAMLADEARQVSQERAARGEDPEDVSWTDLLRRPVNRKTLQTLMTKDLFSSDEEYEEELADPRELRKESWGSLLNRPINGKTLKALLTKKIGSKGKDPKKPVEAD